MKSCLGNDGKGCGCVVYAECCLFYYGLNKWNLKERTTWRVTQRHHAQALAHNTTLIKQRKEHIQEQTQGRRGKSKSKYIYIYRYILSGIRAHTLRTRGTYAARQQNNTFLPPSYLTSFYLLSSGISCRASNLFSLGFARIVVT